MTAVDAVFVIVVVVIAAALAKSGMPVPSALALISGAGGAAVRMLGQIRPGSAARN